MSLVIYAAPHRIAPAPAAVDHYASRGVVLSRDAAHLAIQALSRDAHELAHRGGAANVAAAAENRAVMAAIGAALREG